MYENIQKWTNGTETLRVDEVTNRINIRYINPYKQEEDE